MHGPSCLMIAATLLLIVPSTVLAQGGGGGGGSAGGLQCGGLARDGHFGNGRGRGDGRTIYDWYQRHTNRPNRQIGEAAGCAGIPIACKSDRDGNGSGSGTAIAGARH